MSNEWKLVRLGDVFSLQMGKTPDRKNSNYWSNGTNKWISIADMSDSKYINHTKESISDIAIEECGIKPIPSNTVIMSFKLSIGKVCITEEELYSNEAIMAFIPKTPNSIDLSFLYYRLLSHNWTLGINKAVKGITLNKASISDTVILFQQSLSRQKEIAGILDKASELIEKRKEQLRELDSLAESVFQDMFGDPVTNEKGWAKKRLGELGKWQSGGTPSRKIIEYFNGDIPWVTSGELNNIFINDSIEYISEDAVIHSNTKIIPNGSLLLGMYDSAALKSSISTAEITCNQAIAYSTLSNNLCNTVFVYYIIQINKNVYKKEQRGIRQKNLNLSMIKDIEILYPPLSLQNQFAAIIEKIEEQKAKVKEALKESEDLFQRLMQDLFNPDQA